MRVGSVGMFAELSVGLIIEKPQLSILSIRRQAKIEECLVGRLVPGSDLHDSACVVSRRNLTSQFLRQADHLFYLLYGPHALAFLAPYVVFNADSHVQPERDRDVAQGQNSTHPRLHEHDRAVWRRRTYPSYRMGSGSPLLRQSPPIDG